MKKDTLTIIMLIIIGFIFFILTGCGTFKSINNPYNKKQLLWGKTQTEGVYTFNNYWKVTEEYYHMHKIGDEFILKKGDLK